jgi:hypothetical protein
MQHLLEPLIPGRVTRRHRRLLILAQELAAFLLSKTPEDHLRIARILLIHRLSGHAGESTPAT